MKSSSLSIIIVSLLMFLSSCKDSFLDLAPISSMNENNFFKTENDFKTAVNGAYRTLYNTYSPTSMLAYSEQMSDNCVIYHIAGNASERSQFKDYNILADNTSILGFWNSYYNSLFVINTVIGKLSDSPLSDELKTKYEAEMRFLRGLYYFDMVRIWGDVPLLTKPVSVNESYEYGRSPVDEVYKQIIADLTFAEANLPGMTQIGRVGQATKGAAQGMLGKVYATIGDSNNAKIFLKKLIDSNEYGLLPSYSQLWDLAHENSKESLFEIQYVRGVSSPSSTYYQAFTPFEKVIYGGGMNQVTPDLWDEYEDGDVRRDLSIYAGYAEGGSFVENPYPKKWTDPNCITSGSTRLCENNFIVLRYADILLLYADLTQDEQYLNRVRQRAGLPEWATPGYPVSQYPTLDLAIEHERRVELALEFHRWFDLKRTNRAITVLSAAKGKTIQNWQLLLPVPQSVVDQNPNIIIQNPNYE